MRTCPPEPLWQRLTGEFPGYEVPFLKQEPKPMPEARKLGLVLAYDGAAYAGWQVQPKAVTLQGVVEGALSTLCNHPIRVESSGRTDRGVHALGQTVSFSTKSRLSLERMERGLKSILPQDILVRALGPTPQDFHARFSAKAKTYEYFLRPSSPDGLFLAQRLWLVKERLDPGPIHEALAGFTGEQDLKALSSHSGDFKGGTVRKIMAANMEESPSGIWRIRVTASGFLRGVVRNLVGVMVQMGRGSLAPDDLPAMIKAGRRYKAGPKAPAQGLYLSKVYYRDEEIPGGKH